MKEENQPVVNSNGDATTKLVTATIAGTEKCDFGATVTSGGQQDILPGIDPPGDLSSEGFPGRELPE